MRVLAQACLVIALLLLGSPRPGARAPSFTLGVVRQDGVLVPFAAYDGSRWRNAWPVPAGQTTVPISLHDIPNRWWGPTGERQQWVLFPTRGAGSQPVRLVAPIWFAAQCQMNIGVRTDYRSSAGLPTAPDEPAPKAGLAAAGQVAIEPVEVLGRQSPEWEEFTERVQAPFAEAENNALARSGGWAHPYAPKERAALPARLDVLCRSRFRPAGAWVYYVEASKRYEVPDAEGNLHCTLVAFAAGWARVDERGGKLELQAAISDCAGSGFLYTLPLGAIRLDKNLLWIVQRSTWGYERYDVLEIRADEVKTVLETPGGTCY